MMMFGKLVRQHIVLLKQEQSIYHTEILALDGISVADISLINELQKAIKSNKVIAFLSGTE